MSKNPQNYRNVFKINKRYSKKPINLFAIVLVCVVLAFGLISFLSLENLFNTIFNSTQNLFNVIKEMFDWNWNNLTYKDSVGEVFLINVFKSVWDTISLGLVGTIIGVLFSVPIAVLASSTIVKSKFVNNTCKTFLAILRAVPAVTLALIFVGYFDTSTFAVLVSITVFTFGRASKMLYERIEQIDTRVFVAMQATGANKIKSFRTAVIPEISNHVLFTFFYILQSNIKYMAIIGVSTKTGIGTIIQETYELPETRSRMGFALTALVLMVLALEFVMFFVKYYILYDKDYLMDGRKVRKINTQFNKRIRQSNLQFYLNEVMCKDINEQFYNLKKSKIKNKKAHLKSLKQQKKQMTTTFTHSYKSKIAHDVQTFKHIQNKTPIQNKLFVFNKQYDVEIRIDKVTQTLFNFEVNTLKEELKQRRDQMIDALRVQFKKDLTVDQALASKPKKYLKRVLFFGAVMLLFIYAFSTIDIQIASKASIHRVNQTLKNMFAISWTSLFKVAADAQYSVIFMIYQTLQMAVLGTIIGGVFAYVFGLLSSSRITNKYIARLVSMFVDVMRSVPSYIYALILSTIIPMGVFAGYIALAIGTTWSLAKYNKEVFNDINMKIINQLEAVGFNKWQVFKYGVVPQTTTPIVAYLTFSFDGNSREVTILGNVGAGAMGLYLKNYFVNGYYALFGALFLGVIIQTLVVEYLSNAVRAKLLNDQNLIVYDWIMNKYRQWRFALYKANEHVLLNTHNLSYEEAHALFIFSKAGKLNRLAKKRINKDRSQPQVRTPLEQQYLIFKAQRALFIKNLKQEMLNQKKHLLMQYKKINRQDLNGKMLRHEIRSNLRFIKKVYNFKIKNLEY